MKADAHREWRELIGAYVLGGLEADEAARVEAHLDGCEHCRREAEALAPLQTLLNRAEVSRIAAAPRPPARLGRRVMARIREESRARRRQRVRLALAGAVAALALGGAIIAGAGLLSSSDGTAPTERVVSWKAPHGAFEVAATLTQRSFGTELQMTVWGVREGTLCHVSVREADGETVPAGTFHYWHTEGEAPPTLSAAVSLDEAKALIVRAGAHRFAAPIVRSD
jgi:predicted anti-sigma-YlaC factor YlaD